MRADITGCEFLLRTLNEQLKDGTLDYGNVEMAVKGTGTEQRNEEEGEREEERCSGSECRTLCARTCMAHAWRPDAPVARIWAGLGRKHIDCVLRIFSGFVLQCVEEVEVLETWMERDLGTLRMAGAAENSTKEAEQRKRVLTAIWKDRVKLNHGKLNHVLEKNRRT